MKNRLFLIYLLLYFILPYQVYANEENISQLSNRIATLEKEISSAMQQQALWRDTAMLLSQAKSLLASNEITETQEIVNKIEFQLLKSLEQSHSQNDISELVPYYLKN